MSQYDAVAQRAYAKIAERGGDVVFSVPGVPTFDESTGRMTGGASSSVTGKAVRDTGNPLVLAALNLRLIDSITLLVAGWGLGVVPVPDMAFTFGGTMYSVKDADRISPDGSTVITYTITGSR